MLTENHVVDVLLEEFVHYHLYFQFPLFQNKNPILCTLDIVLNYSPDQFFRRPGQIIDEIKKQLEIQVMPNQLLISRGVEFKFSGSVKLECLLLSSKVYEFMRKEKPETKDELCLSVWAKRIEDFKISKL